MTAPRLDDQLCFAVYAAQHAIAGAYAPMLKQLGLTFPQFLVMMVLWEDDDLSVGAIGDRLMLDSGTLTPLLRRLERAGRVRRTRDPGDERRVRIALTDAGAALADDAGRLHEALVCGLAEGDRARLEALRDALHALTRGLRPAS